MSTKKPYVPYYGKPIQLLHWSGLGAINPSDQNLTMRRYRKLPRRIQWPVYTFLGLGLAMVVFTNMVLFRFINKDRSKIKRVTPTITSKRTVCICLADDRFSRQDLEMATIDNIEELANFARTRLGPVSELQYWQKTALINTAYALKFGHKIIMSDLSAYRNVFQERRPSVWLKPSFMLDLIHTRPGCDWFASMDSDAYFWMSNHTVDLWRWFSTGSIHEASHHYYEFEEEKWRRWGFYDWDEQTAFFLVGLNGVFSNPAEGFPNFYEDDDNDFICAGVYFIKNDKRGKQFLHDWVSGPVNATAEEHIIMQEFALKFSFEQRVLNAVLYPRYKDGIQIYSFRDFGSKGGPLIRHTWSQYYKERDPLMNIDLTKLGF